MLYLLIAYLRNGQGRYFLENYTIKGALTLNVENTTKYPILLNSIPRSKKEFSNSQITSS